MSLSNNFPTQTPSLLLDFANTKQLDPRVSFTRTTTARYYDGVTVAKAEENLIQYSQEFDNPYWTTTRLTLTANATTAPDGTATAEATEQNNSETVAGAVYKSNFVSVAGIYTSSVFAKANTKDFLAIGEELATGSLRRTWFDLNNGTVGTTDAGHTASILSVGNGWYRCSITFTATARTDHVCLFYHADTDGSATVTDSGGIYIWGAQLEQRSAVTAYTPTTTQPITNYIPVLLTANAGQPRFDHNPTTGESLGLLVEEQRTNLLLRSDDFANAYWSKTSSSVQSNTIIAPDGTLTADKYVPDNGLLPTTSSTGLRRVSISLSTGSIYTFSVFAKKGEFDTWATRDNYVSGNLLVINLTTGVIVSNPAFYTNVKVVDCKNNWWRISYTFVAPTTTYVVEVARTNSTGDGYSGIYIWGAQLEAGAFPTSYIPTVASTVTRNADALSMTGTNFSSCFNNAEGTLYAEASQTSSTSNVFALGNSLANYILLRNRANGVTGTPVNIVVNSSEQTSFSSVTYGAVNKSSLSYKVNDFALSVNNASVLTATSGILPVVTEAQIGRIDTFVSTCTIKKLAYYPIRVSNTNLQALTT